MNQLALIRYDNSLNKTPMMPAAGGPPDLILNQVPNIAIYSLTAKMMNGRQPTAP